MANRIDATLSGAGSLAMVTDAIAHDVDSQEAATVVARWSDAIQSAICPNKRLDRRFLALVAAALNADFMDSGYLYRTRTDGRFERDYFATESERQLIADLLTD